MRRREREEENDYSLWLCKKKKMCEEETMTMHVYGLNVIFNENNIQLAAIQKKRKRKAWHENMFRK